MQEVPTSINKRDLHFTLLSTEVMTSQKWFFGNYGIYWDILKGHDEKCLLAKNHCLIAIWGCDIGPLMLQWLHTNPCNFLLVLTSVLYWLQKKILTWQGYLRMANRSQSLNMQITIQDHSPIRYFYFLFIYKLRQGQFGRRDLTITRLLNIQKKTTTTTMIIKQNKLSNYMIQNS